MKKTTAAILLSAAYSAVSTAVLAVSVVKTFQAEKRREQREKHSMAKNS